MTPNRTRTTERGTSRYPFGVRRAAWALVVALGCKPEPAPVVDPGPRPRADLVALQQAGHEPHQVYNYDPRDGVTVDMGFQLDTRMTVSVDGETRPSAAPPTAYRVRYEVSQVTPEQFTLSGRLLGVDADRRGVRSAAEISQTRHWTTFDWGGNALEVTADDLGARGDRLNRLMGTLAELRPPLPGSPIGVGARWSAPARKSFGDLHLTGTTVYELRGIEGPVLTIVAQTSFDPPGKDFHPPGVPRGTVANVKQFEGLTRATLQIDLSRPGWSNSAARTDIELAYTAPSQDVSPIPHRGSFQLTHQIQSFDRGAQPPAG